MTDVGRVKVGGPPTENRGVDPQMAVGHQERATRDAGLATALLPASSPPPTPTVGRRERSAGHAAHLTTMKVPAVRFRQGYSRAAGVRSKQKPTRNQTHAIGEDLRAQGWVSRLAETAEPRVSVLVEWTEMTAVWEGGSCLR